MIDAYSLVTMDITRKQFTNTEPGKEFFKGPMNTFVSLTAFPPADMKAVVRPNFDTLYSSAWLDLTKDPMVVSVPDTNGRYYLLPMLDMWTDVFASPGWRTTGTRAGDYAWCRQAGAGRCLRPLFRIDAPTPYVWIIGRTKTDGPADYDAVHGIQAGLKSRRCCAGVWPEPVAGTVDPGVDMKTPPKITGRRDAGRRFLRLCSRSLQVAAATYHRSTDRRSDAEDRNRAWQELRHRGARSRCARTALASAPRRLWS